MWGAATSRESKGESPRRQLKQRRSATAKRNSRRVLSVLTGNILLSFLLQHIVGDFLTKKEQLHVVKPYATIYDPNDYVCTTALERLVDNRVTGFPVIDDCWKLVYYDLLALDSISGYKFLFPEVDSTWKVADQDQWLGRRGSDDARPLVVRETTNLKGATPVVDGTGYLVSIITRGNVIAALNMKRKAEIVSVLRLEARAGFFGTLYWTFAGFNAIGRPGERHGLAALFGI
ncbi:unnamed protein product [Spirodela intermedia]|uniref:Uncharacterized protein n=1 Tax=Spirodela intermedia TaxID=51605 RepID=A0A7I8IW98_SPIIN|nr:unnamed protein product [Spirodela intermedia]CAA6661421.1 unnamed protein product [Spirodela intermedia]